MQNHLINTLMNDPVLQRQPVWGRLRLRLKCSLVCNNTAIIPTSLKRLYGINIVCLACSLMTSQSIVPWTTNHYTKGTRGSGLYERIRSWASHYAAKSLPKTALRRRQKTTSTRICFVSTVKLILYNRALQDVNSMPVILCLRKAIEATLTETTARLLQVKSSVAASDKTSSL